jgi:hypothetical protein
MPTPSCHGIASPGIPEFKVAQYRRCPRIDAPTASPYAPAMTNPLSLDQLKRAVQLRERIAALENELAGILGGEVPTPAPPADAGAAFSSAG